MLRRLLLTRVGFVCRIKLHFGRQGVNPGMSRAQGEAWLLALGPVQDWVVPPSDCLIGVWLFILKRSRQLMQHIVGPSSTVVRT